MPALLVAFLVVAAHVVAVFLCGIRFGLNWPAIIAGAALALELAVWQRRWIYAGLRYLWRGILFVLDRAFPVILPEPEGPPRPPLKPRQPVPIPTIKCQHCGGQMFPDTIAAGGGCVGWMGAALVLLAGVAVFFLIPVVGWIAGPIICLFAFFVGWSQRSKVWRCGKCGVVLGRVEVLRPQG
jgi:hypothetical protein